MSKRPTGAVRPPSNNRELVALRERNKELRVEVERLQGSLDLAVEAGNNLGETVTRLTRELDEADGALIAARSRAERAEKERDDTVARAEAAELVAEERRERAKAAEACAERAERERDEWQKHSGEHLAFIAGMHDQLARYQAVVEAATAYRTARGRQSGVSAALTDLFVALDEVQRPAVALVNGGESWE